MALSAWSGALAAQTAPWPASPPVSQEFPKRLAITIVGDPALLGTFQRRVGSWFSDGTQVQVTIESQVDAPRLLASSPTEVRAWIVPLSSQRALLTFSSVTPPAAPRHLVREVRLRDGFDELGLERLASVTHSAFVALSEGIEGVEREQAERELGAAVGASRPTVPPNEPPPPARLAPPVSSASPAVRPRPRVAPTAARPAPPSSSSPGSGLLLAAGYGVRLRGAEGIGQGPSLALGVQLRRSRLAVDLLLSGQYLFRSAFQAKPFDASVQTTALRAQVGIESGLGSAWLLQGLLGLGADLARISASASSVGDGNTRVVPRANGSQWRGEGELTLGVLRRGERLDLGIFAQAMVALENVHYSAATADGESLLVEPWRVQPALSLQGRFRSAL